MAGAYAPIGDVWLFRNIPGRRLACAASFEERRLARKRLRLNLDGLYRRIFEKDRGPEQVRVRLWHRLYHRDIGGVYKE